MASSIVEKFYSMEYGPAPEDAAISHEFFNLEWMLSGGDRCRPLMKTL